MRLAVWYLSLNIAYNYYFEFYPFFKIYDFILNLRKHTDLDNQTI